MKELSRDYWNRFKDSNLKYNGLKFEKLIDELLAIMYGQKWIQTKKTHDNNRDFWLFYKEKKIWAECKNYRDPISMNILAPTLVMAQIYDTNTILFFSRSKINLNAKDKILAYGEKTQKKIIFYDAEILENLILFNASKLSKKFQPNNIFKKENSLDGCVSMYFFQDAFNTLNINDDEFIEYSYAQKIRYNEAFCLKIIIKNPCLDKKVKVAISFKENSLNRFNFEYLDNSIQSTQLEWKNLFLEPGEGISITVNLRLNIYKKKVTFPLFEVNIFDEKELVYTWSNKPIEIECLWVGHTKLIGSQYETIRMNTAKQLVDNTRFSSLFLVGGSGTGKTRMSQECSSIFLKNGYKILNITSNNNFSSSYLIKEILYYIYEIPKDLILSELEQKTINIKHKKKYNNNFKVENAAVNMLQVLSDLTTEDEIKEFLVQFGDIIYEKISREKYVILVDNIQFAGYAFQYFVEQYVYYSVNQNRSNYSVLIIVFNQDYMTSDTSELLFNLLNANIHYVLEYELKGFKQISQGILFLRELIHIKGEQYDNFFSEIIHRVSLKPYNLYQTIKLLEEEEVIKVSPNDTGYIFIGEETVNLTEKLCENFTEVLNRRWEIIINAFSEKNIYCIFSAVYLFEQLEPHIIKLFKFDTKILSSLCNKHFLKQNSLGNYEFDHDIIRKYFENEHYHKLLFCLYDLHNRKQQKFLRFNIIAYDIYQISISKNVSHILKKAKNLKQIHIPQRISKVYFEKLFNEIILLQENFDNIIQWIGTIQNICAEIRSNSGSKSAKTFYKRVLDFINTSYEDYSQLYSYDFRKLIHSYCDILVELHERQNAEDLIKDILNRSNQYNQLNSEQSDERLVLRAIMYNRLYVSYNIEEPTEEILIKRQDLMKKSRNNIEGIKDEEKRRLIKYLNDSDEGYNYYGFLADKAKLFSIWNDCTMDIPKLVPEKTLNYYRKLIQYDLINQDYDMIFEHISEGQQYLESGDFSHEPLIFNTFFIMAEIMAYLQKEPLDKHFYINKLIDKTIHIQHLLKNGKMGDILMVKGVNAYYWKECEEVYYSFRKAYDEYLQKRTSRYWVKQELLLENIHRAFTELKIYSKNYDVSFLPKKYRIPLTKKQLKCLKASGIQQTMDGKMNLPLFN